MNPEIKDEWVKALRSGEYEQTVGLLHRVATTIASAHPVGYCCLGVLCELAVKAGVISKRLHDGDFAEDYGNETGRSGIDLPVPVKEWAGIDDLPGTGDSGIITDLICYNDDGKPFSFIADQIEARL